MHAAFVTLALALAVSAGPLRRQNDFALKNGQDAIALNEKFKTFTDGGNCDAATDANACVGTSFAQCVNGKFVVQACAPGTICAALPLVNSAGTSVTCTTAADRDARIAATGATAAGAGNTGNTGNNQGAGNNTGDQNNAGNGGAAGNNGGNTGAAEDPQVSLTLDPKVIAAGFKQDGQATPVDGQVPSLTSSNNFINFCLTVNAPITDGKQVQAGSCNPAPIGVIPSVDKMPSSKFTSPKNGDTVAANKQFTISMAITNLQAGNFVNAATNYFAAPQQLNGDGIIIGHTHVVLQKMDSVDSTAILDAKKFVFFKGVNGAAQGGVVTADVTDGIPAGAYRLCSINTSANHAPAIGPVAQHGSFDDCVYLTAA
jgi:hypothetical protein